MKRTILKIIKLIGLIIIILFFVSVYIQKIDKDVVAYYLGDYEFEPIVFRNELYFPDTAYSYGENWYIEKDAEQCGKISNKNLYEKKGKLKTLVEYLGYLHINHVWVDNCDNNYEHLIMRGGVGNEYSKVSYLENASRIQELLENYSSFILVSKNYTYDKKCIISKDVVSKLEGKYGECNYVLEDFSEMSEAYYIYMNPFFQHEGSNEELRIEAEKNRYVSGNYVATIFVDDNGKLYYCNSNNLIDEKMSKEIYAILEAGGMLE